MASSTSVSSLDETTRRRSADEDVSYDSSDIAKVQLRHSLQSSFILACIEASFALVEFWVVVVFLHFVFRAATSPFINTRDHVNSIGVCACVLGLCWTFYRNKAVWEGVKRSTSMPLSLPVAAVLCFQTLMFLMFAMCQYLTGAWMFGLDNYFTRNGDGGRVLDVAHVLLLIIVTPVCEETLFRGVIVGVLQKREKSVHRCILVSSTMFGLFHLINLFSPVFPLHYIAVQILIAFTIGAFYSALVLAYGPSVLWQCVLLHVFNNFLASFSPTHTTLSNPYVLAAVCENLLVYSFLTWWVIRDMGNNAATEESPRRSE